MIVFEFFESIFSSLLQPIADFISFFLSYISSLFQFIHNVYDVIPSMAFTIFSELPSYYQVGITSLISLSIGLLALKFLSLFF